MAANEPKGLDMSLDEIIAQSKYNEKLSNEEESFTCFSCGRLFATLNEVHFHKKKDCHKKKSSIPMSGNPVNFTSNNPSFQPTFGQQFFNCKKCFAAFLTFPELKFHSKNCSVIKSDIHCFTCKANGILTNFASYNDLTEHRKMMHGYIEKSSFDRKRKAIEPKSVSVTYSWTDEGTSKEALSVLYEEISLLKVSSSGDVYVNGNINHTIETYTAINACLAPVNMKITYSSEISSEWKLSLASGWSAVLNEPK